MSRYKQKIKTYLVGVERLFKDNTRHIINLESDMQSTNFNNIVNGANALQIKNK